MKADIAIEKLTGHAPMAVSIVRKAGRRPSTYIIRAVADFMREHGLEELEAYYGQEAVASALKSETPSESVEEEPVEGEDGPGLQEQVESEPVAGAELGVQPGEAEAPNEPEGKVRKGTKAGKSLIDREGG
jgi:hypothetical protein